MCQKVLHTINVMGLMAISSNGKILKVKLPKIMFKSWSLCKTACSSFHLPWPFLCIATAAARKKAHTDAK